MAEEQTSIEMSRRGFIGRSAAGVTGLSLSPLLLEMLLAAPGCRPAGSKAASDLILPEDVLNQAVRRLMGKGADFADVYVERAAFGTVQDDDKKVKTSTLIEKGVGLRAVKEGRTYYAYTASFEPADVYKTADYVADAAAQGGSGAAGAVIALTRATSSLAFPITPLPADVAVTKRIEQVKALSDRAWSADKRIVQVMELLREIIRQVNIASSDGPLVNQTLAMTEFMAMIYGKDAQGRMQSGWDGRGAYAGSEFFTGENSFETVVDTAARKVKNLFDAVDSPRGRFPVVLAPGVPGVIFHESCGHGMEADLVFKGSNFKDQLGKPTAAKGVTLVDDGTLPSLPGSYAFDDEGTPSERTVLIEDGIQRNYLCDKVWGRKLGLKSTGSGRRQSFRYPPIPRMRNTFIETGAAPPQDIIAATTRGIYVADAGGGGQVDVITGNFMMGVGEGYLIENGKITRPIKGASLSGLGIEALKSIDMVGNDLKMDPSAGRCGKGQTAPIGVGMPTVRVRGILVGGAGESWAG
jgi:TldD protein